MLLDEFNLMLLLQNIQFIKFSKILLLLDEFKLIFLLRIIGFLKFGLITLFGVLKNHKTVYMMCDSVTKQTFCTRCH